MTPKDEQDLLNYIKIMAPITIFFGGILTGVCLRFFEDIFYLDRQKPDYLSLFFIYLIGSFGIGIAWHYTAMSVRAKKRLLAAGFICGLIQAIGMNHLGW